MLSKMAGPAIVLLWIGSMSWLVWHDVLPAWTAEAPPANPSVQDITAEQEEQQASITDAHGVRIGTLWTRYYSSADSLRREDTCYLDKVPIPNIPFLLIEVDSTFNEEDKLDELEVKIYGAGFPIELKGERFGKQMGFQLDAGPLKQNFRLEDESSAMIGDCFKPFSTLPNLEVGQTWRMQVFNPMSAILPSMGDKFIPMLVKVSGKETIQTTNGPMECFVVEAKNAKAWVGQDGRVYEQQAEIPMGGTITIRPEPFDADSLKKYRLDRLKNRE